VKVAPGGQYCTAWILGEGAEDLPEGWQLLSALTPPVGMATSTALCQKKRIRIPDPSRGI
jgi:hypothetical protein